MLKVRQLKQLGMVSINKSEVVNLLPSDYSEYLFEYCLFSFRKMLTDD